VFLGLAAAIAVVLLGVTWMAARRRTTPAASVDPVAVSAPVRRDQP
jgi:FlaG/FlaF family flagellin (archaellin)